MLILVSLVADWCCGRFWFSGFRFGLRFWRLWWFGFASGAGLLVVCCSCQISDFWVSGFSLWGFAVLLGLLVVWLDVWLCCGLLLVVG